MPPGRPRRTSFPTISEVAAEAGVGRASAARALGDYGSVSPEMRRKVEEAARRLGYRPNALAWSMSTGVTRTVGVVVGDVSNPFFGAVTRGISDQMHTEEIDCLVASTDEDVVTEAEIIEALVRKQVDGIIVASTAGVDHPVLHLEAARTLGVPVVLVDRVLRRFEAPAVVLDNVAAARAATQLLLDAGHRRIGLVWGPAVGDHPTGPPGDTLSTIGERFEGYRDALAAAGLEVDERLVAPRPATLADAPRATASMLTLDDPPTALVTTESDATLTTLRRLRDHGLRCPEDVSVVAFDDAPWTDLTDPPLSVVRQPAVDMGRHAARILLALMAKTGADTGPDAAEPTGTVVLPADILVRASVAAPRA
ncbi:LacI family DNA-binding transcriptional regulator [Streptomyces sp. NPDC047000]|uniref:LacI family DNA-binding transcriptional regulator n=1 Tax=Streptomyces sp. NPDC047000 TaxID=3155474 RepID=UPI003403C150